MDHNANPTGLALGARLQEAASREQRSRSFQVRFPPLTRVNFIPPVTWEELERQLCFLNGTDRACWEVEVLRKEARSLTPEHFLQRLLILAWAAIDESPGTAAAATEEAAMP